jgi:hypothetical protein
MNHAGSNESQDKQQDRTAESPIKTPAAETAHVSMSDANKAAAGAEAHAGAHAKTPIPQSADTTIGPEGERERRPRGADVVNDDTLDDTVDADGKSRDAQREAEMLAREPDRVIANNATSVNFVPTPSDGLGGFDSRPARNGVLLMLEQGYRMVDRGMVAPMKAEVDERLLYEGRDAHGHALRGRKHYALNHLRPARLFEIERS